MEQHRHDHSAVDSKPNTDPVHAISSHFLADFSARRVFNGELTMTDSQQLLTDYSKNGSETAFRELVTHYIDLVFSTALRLVGGDAHRAEDIVQTVFMDLARQASKLSRGTNAWRLAPSGHLFRSCQDHAWRTPSSISGKSGCRNERTECH